MELIVENEADWSRIMPRIMEEINSEKVICLEGDLGVGKTSFVKAFCAHLGVKDTVQSPTYSIVNSYFFLAQGQKKVIYHLDLYRLETHEDLVQIGIEDILTSADWLLVEWPELIFPFLDEYLYIHIDLSDNFRRLMDFKRMCNT